jgi:ABC-type multidrug transport system fused ATPase/permease subunit
MPADHIAGSLVYSGARANLGYLRPFIVRHWRKGALGAFLILSSTLLGFPQPLINRYLIDQVILARRIDLLAGVVLLMIGIKIIGIVSGLLQQYTFTRFEQRVLLDIQHDLLDRTLRLPKSFFDEKDTGYLMSRLMSDVGGLRWFFSSTIIQIGSQVISFAGGAALLFYLEWRLAIVAVVVLPGLVLGVRYFSSKLRVLSHHQMEQQAQVMRSMEESLAAVPLIKAFASEERTVQRIVAQWEASLRVSLEQMAVGSLASLSISLTSEAARTIVLVAGAYLVIRGEWTLGSLLAFQSYLGNVHGPAQFLAGAGLQVQSALAALERVSALFTIVPEEKPGSGKMVEHLRGEVEFRHVSFSYGGGDVVLNDLSFSAAPGESIAIVGPSGVGKTTLLSLILRFYRPSQGEIWFDGEPASAYDLGSLRQRIGYVSQNPVLLSGTMLDNLRYGNLEASLPQVVRAAQAAGIHDFVASLPDGYDTHVGEHGVNLSEGQKQRLAIARALIKDPDILILDEPTSALDSIIERSIFDALPALVRGKTSFVVAHRLATVQDADRILLLNEKRLVAEGTHQELLATNEYYQALVANQHILTAEDAKS